MNINSLAKALYRLERGNDACPGSLAQDALCPIGEEETHPMGEVPDVK